MKAIDAFAQQRVPSPERDMPAPEPGTPPGEPVIPPPEPLTPAPEPLSTLHKMPWGKEEIRPRLR